MIFKCNTTKHGLLNINNENLLPTNYNETNLIGLFAIRKQLTGDSPVYIGEEMDDYIEVIFRQQNIDWYITEE